MGLFQLLGLGDGKGVAGFTLVGPQGIAWLKSKLEILKDVLGAKFESIIAEWDKYRGWLTAGGGIAGLLLGLGVGPVGAIIAAGIGAGIGDGLVNSEIDTITQRKDQLNAMIDNLESQLDDISEAMNRQSDHGTHTAIVVSAAYQSGYDPENNLNMMDESEVLAHPWEIETMQVTDVIGWQ